MAAHIRLKALQSITAQDAEARLRHLIIKHVKLLIGDLAEGLLSHAAACLKRVYPDPDLSNFIQSMHTKFQLITLFLLSQEDPSQEFCTPIAQRLQALTSYSFKIKGLPPSLLGKTPAGETPLATLLDRLKGVRFLVLDSIPISDSIMSFLYHNFENLDSLSVSGCKDISFVVPTSPNYNKSNSRAILQPPMTLPSGGDFLQVSHSFSRSDSDYDLRSLSSSTSSSAYTFNNYDENFLIPNPDSINSLRSSTPPAQDCEDSGSDISSPAISPRNSLTFQDYIMRGGTPPPELRISGESSPTISRSSMHTGHRSNSDGNSTNAPMKLRRSSSTADTPHAIASGSVLSKRTGSETSGSSSPTATRFLRSGSIGEKGIGRVALALGRSGSGEFITVNSHPVFMSTSPPSSSSVGFESASPSKESNSPVLARSTKRLNIIGIGRSTESTSPNSDSHSPRSRNSLKLFSSLSKSGGEGSPESTNPNPSPNKVLTCSGEKGKGEKGLRFAELQFLNCSNCTSLLDKSLQAVALQKLPLQCLYLGGCAKISDAGLIPLFSACTQLKVLEINDCYKITDTAILELARNCPELRELNVSSCKLNASSIERLAKSCQDLVSLNITGVEGITDSTLKVIAYRCTQMHVLVLGHCPNITDSGIQYLSAKLPTSLQVLTINNGAKISDASMSALGNTCSALRNLKLRSSAVSHNSIIGLIQNNSMLTKLNLAESHQIGSPIFDSLLRSALNLRVLKIAQCYGISNSNAFSDPYDLFSSLNGLKNLTTLDWSETNLTNKVLENVCTHCSKITKLKLQACKLITNQALGFISKHLVSLQKLLIDRCPQIDDGGIQQLWSENVTKTLTTLSLIRLPISNKSLEVLCNFETLQNLHLSNSGNLTSESLAKLLAASVELQQVYFVLHNANTESDSFLALKKQFPRIKLYFVESGGRK